MFYFVLFLLLFTSCTNYSTVQQPPICNVSAVNNTPFFQSLQAPVEDEKLHSYVSSIFLRVTDSEEAPNFFFVLSSNPIALCLSPNVYVISLGLLERLDSEAELASILALLYNFHEEKLYSIPPLPRQGEDSKLIFKKWMEQPFVLKSHESSTKVFQKTYISLKRAQYDLQGTLNFLTRALSFNTFCTSIIDMRYAHIFFTQKLQTSSDHSFIARNSYTQKMKKSMSYLFKALRLYEEAANDLQRAKYTNALTKTHAAIRFLKNPNMFVLEGLCYFRQGQRHLAKKSLEHALEEVDHAKGYLIYAQLMQEEGEFLAAMQAAKKADYLLPTDSSEHLQDLAKNSLKIDLEDLF